MNQVSVLLNGQCYKCSSSLASVPSTNHREASTLRSLCNSFGCWAHSLSLRGSKGLWQHFLEICFVNGCCDPAGNTCTRSTLYNLSFWSDIFLFVETMEQVFFWPNTKTSCPLLRDAATIKVNMSGRNRARITFLVCEQSRNESRWRLCSTCRRVGRLGKAKLGPLGHKTHKTLNEKAASLMTVCLLAYTFSCWLITFVHNKLVMFDDFSPQSPF